MLVQLTVQNYALIQSLDLALGKDLTVITGETGAGKSILLGALGLLKGKRSDTKVLLDENQKCVVEGEFDISKLNLQSFYEENDLDYLDVSTIRREINPNGKSRTFINDTPVTLDVLSVLGEQLMDIHSQHDTLLLANKSYQLDILDSFADNHEIVVQYKTVFKEWGLAQKELVKLKSEAQQIQKELDYNSFLFEELTEAKLTQINLEDIEEQQKQLENADSIAAKLGTAKDNLGEDTHSSLETLRISMHSLQSISELSKKSKELSQRMESVYIEVKDIHGEVENLLSSVEYDPETLDVLNQKINEIYRLFKKHNVDTIGDLIVIMEGLDTKINLAVNSESICKDLELKILEHEGKLNTLGESIRQTRKKAAQVLQKDIIKSLAYLGMADAKIEIEFIEKIFSMDGIDEIQWLFSANQGQRLHPLKDVASGGEFSRLMLAIKYQIAQRNHLPTIVFDEIDTGVSGEVANKIGKMLEDLSSKMQVLVITHLQQIASKGKQHLFVFKEKEDGKTISKIKLLNNQERVQAIAQMLSGDKPTEIALQNAAELLGI
ncbi:MAG: DNA repair protein RecN [Leadbetterella sp.]